MYLSRPAVEVVSDVVDAALQLRDALYDGLELGPAQPKRDALCDCPSIAKVKQNVAERARISITEKFFV